MHIRRATPDDAQGISNVLMRLYADTKPTSPDHAHDFYITHPDGIQCTVAEENGMILGFQALKLATKGNIYSVTPGWGVIGTHISPDAARKGVGAALFAETKKAAKNAGLQKVDATIGKTNTGGLAYYEAMGFRTYRTTDSAICKCYEVD